MLATAIKSLSCTIRKIKDNIGYGCVSLGVPVAMFVFVQSE